MAYSGEAGFARATVTTQDAALTNALILALPDNCVAHAMIVVAARRASSGDSATFFADVAAKRHAGGSAAIVGQMIVAVNKDLGAAAWLVNAAVSGTNLQVRVQGEAGAAIDWLAELRAVIHKT
jgi:hypothetical protein